MKIKAQKQNIPALRFLEFSGEWVEKRLGDVSCDIDYGMNSAASAFDGENKYIRITDIDDESRTYKTIVPVSPSEIPEEKYYLKKGDIVFARTGASVGKSYLYKEEDGKLCFAGFLIRFHINKANPYFIYSTTLQNSYSKWVQIMSMRSGQPGINAEEYKTYKFYLPNTSQEQQKIASFLSSVDKKIEQLHAKKQLLEQYKKGMIQKLFSRQIRFKDENGNNYPDWEEKKLGDISKTTTGSSNREDSTEKGQYTFFDRSNDTRASAKYLYDNEAIIVAGEGKDFSPRYFIGKFDLHQRAYAIMEFGNNSGKYLYYWIYWHRQFFLKHSVGSTMPSLRIDSFTKFPVLLPIAKEQTKIANFLSGVDKKINLIETELTKTKTFKKGLLQQMFV